MGFKVKATLAYSC